MKIEITYTTTLIETIPAEAASNLEKPKASEAFS
jgi:hypothetical protein